VVAAGLAGGLGACGDDDDAGTSTGDDAPAAEADLVAACAASVAVDDALDALPQPEGDEATEEDKAATRAAFGPVEDALQAVEDALPDTPEPVADAIAMLRAIGESGDLTAIDEEIGQAVEEHFFDTCEDDQRLEVTAVDYAFEGPAEPVTAGPARIRLINTGAEVHELILFRRADGETRPAEELLALPEAEGGEALTFTSGMGAGPGDDSYAVVGDLEAGSYVMVCFIPVGTATEEAYFAAMESGEEPTTPPHFTQGMIQELTVE